MTLKQEELLGSMRQGTASVLENMRPAQAAQYTGMSVSTLAKLRMRHNRSGGPKYLKITGCVIYRRSDLDAWMDQYQVEPDA
jgi:predicted DNA-binding transcriptional regulator AlpA